MNQLLPIIRRQRRPLVLHNLAELPALVAPELPKPEPGSEPPATMAPADNKNPSQLRRMKKFSNIDRPAWLALWAQGRRRRRVHQVIPPPEPTGPNAPVITGGWAEWEATEPGWFDVSVQWTFDHGAYPPASIEVFVSVDGGAYFNTGSVGSQSQQFTIVQACEGESEYRFKLRYRNASVVGPFSNEYLVSCTL